MKKLRIAVIVLGLVVCTSLPTKRAHAEGGGWYVYNFTLTHWLCVVGGVSCCPGIGC
jgi:hypothetical protein